jgi:hypothetical protein
MAYRTAEEILAGFKEWGRTPEAEAIRKEYHLGSTVYDSSAANDVRGFRHMLTWMTHELLVEMASNKGSFTQLGPAVLDACLAAPPVDSWRTAILARSYSVLGWYLLDLMGKHGGYNDN